MQLSIIAIGRLKDPTVTALCADYLKRIRRHLRIDLVEVRSDADAQRRLDGAGMVIALDAGGRMYSSEEFAAWLQAHQTYERTPVTFVIGGAEGLSPALRKRADRLLSLGPMTLPHRLARVVLVEQLYRALSIQHGEPYHK